MADFTFGDDTEKLWKILSKDFEGSSDLDKVAGELYNEFLHLVENSFDDIFASGDIEEKELVALFVVYELYLTVYNEGDYAFVEIIKDEGEVEKIKATTELFKQVYTEPSTEINNMIEFLYGSSYFDYILRTPPQFLYSIDLKI